MGQGGAEGRELEIDPRITSAIQRGRDRAHEKRAGGPSSRAEHRARDGSARGLIESFAVSEGRIERTAKRALAFWLFSPFSLGGELKASVRQKALR